MNQRTNRENWIDQFKGIGIILVVLGHSIEYVQYVTEQSNVFFSLMDFWLTSFHMPLFFFASAYLQRRNEEKKGTYTRDIIWKKIISIVVPYLAFSFVFWCSKRLMSSSVQSIVTFKDLFMIWLKPLSTLWFLYLLLVFYLCRVLIYKTKLSDILMGVICVIICLASYYVSLPSIFNDTIALRFLRYAFYYEMGILTYNVRENAEHLFKRKTVLLFSGLSSIIIFIIAYCKHYGWIMPILAITELIFVRCICSDKYLKFVAAFGKDSLGIYLLHDYFVCAVVILLNHFGVENIFILAIGAFMISFVSSLFCYRIALVIPGINVVFKPVIDKKK